MKMGALGGIEPSALVDKYSRNFIDNGTDPTLGGTYSPVCYQLTIHDDLESPPPQPRLTWTAPGIICLLFTDDDPAYLTRITLRSHTEVPVGGVFHLYRKTYWESEFTEVVRSDNSPQSLGLATYTYTDGGGVDFCKFETDEDFDNLDDSWRYFYVTLTVGGTVTACSQVVEHNNFT